jgi:hypothetical protein
LPTFSPSNQMETQRCQLKARPGEEAVQDRDERRAMCAAALFIVRLRSSVHS